MADAVRPNGQGGAVIRTAFKMPIIKRDAPGSPRTLSHSDKPVIADSSRINEARQQDWRTVRVKIHRQPATLAQVIGDFPVAPLPVENGVIEGISGFSPILPVALVKPEDVSLAGSAQFQSSIERISLLSSSANG